MSVHQNPPIVPTPSSLIIPLEKIVSELKASRKRARTVTARSAYARDLPNADIAGRVLKDVFAALFPRHGGGQDGTDDGIDFFVGHTLNTALRQLRGLLHQELRFTFSLEQRDDAAIDGAVASILRDFADRLPDVRESVLLDARAAFDGDPSAQTSKRFSSAIRASRRFTIIVSRTSYFAWAHRFWRASSARFRIPAPASTFIPVRKSGPASSSIMAPAS